ncbi:MAG: hypothetical protein NC218_07045 [Acetobacter sp.]|nr:hypothetical protein [Acetobacter sp.]
MSNLNFYFMQKYYIGCRELANGALAFLVMEEDETVTVHAKFPPHTPSTEFLYEYTNIAKVPENLVDEIAERPTWNFHTSPRLQSFIDELWSIVQELDASYIFAD